ncbi:hypothetical protein CALCODRAFT_505115, partial [Calocera cornea HHB12733]
MTTPTSHGSSTHGYQSGLPGQKWYLKGIYQHARSYFDLPHREIYCEPLTLCTSSAPFPAKRIRMLFSDIRQASCTLPLVASGKEVPQHYLIGEHRFSRTEIHYPIVYDETILVLRRGTVEVAVVYANGFDRESHTVLHCAIFSPDVENASGQFSAGVFEQLVNEISHCGVPPISPPALLNQSGAVTQRGEVEEAIVDVCWVEQKPGTQCWWPSLYASSQEESPVLLATRRYQAQEVTYGSNGGTRYVELIPLCKAHAYDFHFLHSGRPWKERALAFKLEQSTTPSNLTF